MYNESMKRHFLQSSAWAEYEKTEGHEVFEKEGEGFAYVAVKHQTPLGAYLYCPYGPALEEKLEPGVALKLALSSLVKLAKEQKAIFVRVEPAVAFSTEEMQKMGLKKSHDLQPAHTWVIDLTGMKEDFLARIEKDRVRRWRNLGKKGVTIRKTKDPKEVGVLIKLLNKLGSARQFAPQSESHLANQLKAGFATLYIAELEENGKKKPIAAALVHDYDGVRFAMHAAADDDYKNLRAGVALAIQSMVDAQEEGAKEFDFWGVTTSEDPKHPWYGFTQYKKSFGGEQVDYAGTWDLPVKKGRYWGYEVMRKVNRVLRKI